MTDHFSEISPKEVIFPPSASVPAQVEKLKFQSSIVVVGANGAGKSRLGSWLELKGPQKDRVHRIAAQRSLVFPESSSPIGLDSARNAFHWAPVPPNFDEATYERQKLSLRAKKKYGAAVNVETAPISDFDSLVTLLFSENYDALLAHEEQQRLTDNLVPIPNTLLRTVQALWESLLPNRSLHIGAGQVRASQKSAPDKEYSARALSDGERVIFYLIGQCLCSQKDAIIVIDEPEIHLHKSIQDALWNSMERARPDCSFVYLTHDLSFASDRIGSTKVCITDYADGKFSWFSIADKQGIPEDIFLEVLGSRKPVIFVEGTRGSADATIYSLAFPEFTVKPVGGCASVVAATKVFRSLEEMHHIKSFGIVDRDYLEQGQINAYQRAGVFVPEVAEIENLFLVPELIKAVATQLLIDPDSTLEKVTTFVFEEFERWLPIHAMEMTQHKIALMLGRFSSSEMSINQYANALSDFQRNIDPVQVHAAAEEEARSALDTRDYQLVLRLFNKKEVLNQLGRFFGITNITYVEKVKEMAKRGMGNIPLILKAYLPDIDPHS